MGESLHPELTKRVMELITRPYQNDVTNRWVPGLTNAQHHSMRMLSASQIKHYVKSSPFNFYKKYILKDLPPQKFNKAFVLGTLIHLAILEPEKFDKFVVVCDLDQRTNAYRDFINESFGVLAITGSVFNESKKDDNVIECEYLDEEVKEAIEEIVESDAKKIKKSKVAPKEKKVTPQYILNQTKDGAYIKGGEEYFVVTSEEMAMLRGIQKSAMNHKSATLLLGHGEPEISGVAQDPYTGMFMNIRGDWRGHDYFVDVKSSAGNASEDDARKSIENFHYGFQHAHYLETANLIAGCNQFKKFHFFFVSKEAPYECGFYHMDKEDILKHMTMRRNILNRIYEHQESGQWEGVNKGKPGTVIKLNPWYYKNLDKFLG